MADYVLSAKITGDSSGFEKAFSTAQKAADGFEAKMQSISSKVSSVGDKIAGVGGKLSVISAGFGTAGAAGVKYNATIEQLETSFATMTGSAEKASGIVSELQKIGAATPFEFTDLADTTQLLMNFGFTADGAIDSMQMLGDISQGSAEKMGSIARAFGKMNSAGKVSLEDINMMIDAGFNPLQEISENTGESMASLYERISSGAMSVDEITASMQRSTSEGGKYFQSMQAQSQTFSGQMSTLSDNANTFLGNMTGGIFERLARDILPRVNDAISTVNDAFTSGGFQGAVDAVKQMSPVLDSMLSKVEIVSAKLSSVGIDPAVFAAVAVAAGPLLIVLGKVFGIVGGAVGVIGKVGGALSILASPIAVVITAIAALAAGFMYLMSTNDAFRERVVGAWQGIQSAVVPLTESIREKCSAIFAGIGDGSAIDGVAETFGGTVGKIQPVFETIKGLVSSAVGFIKPLLSGVFEGFIQTAASLAPAFQSIFGTLSTVVGTVVEAFSGFFTGLAGGFSGGLNSANGFQTGFMTILGLISPPLKMILVLFKNFGPEIQNLVGVIGSSLVPIFTTLGTTLGGIATAIFPAVQSCIANLIPAISSIVTIGKELLTSVIQMLTSVLPVIVGLINQLAPFLVQLAQIIGRVMAALAPMIAQLVSAVVPVITNIISVVQNIFTVIMNVVTAAMPAVIAVMNVVMSIIQAVIPVLTNIISVITSIASFAITMIANIIAAISPIVAFIGGIISNIISVIAPIITFIANVIATIIGVVGTIAAAVSGVLKVIVSVFSGAFIFISGIWQNILDVVTTIINSVSRIISGISGVVGGVFNGIYSIVSTIMTNVGNFIQGIFDGIQSAWNGLTSFVGGIFNGVSSAVSDLVNTVKGFVNDVIGGINWALDIINKIPGVSISPIPYLLHGTDNWGGGFARMNEGGRGELTYLPNGTQVIPHDISVQYAKEAARTNAVSAEGTGSTESAVYNGVYDAVYSLVRNGVIKNGDGEYSALGISGDDIVRIFKQKNESHKIAHGGLGILDM